MLTGTASSDFNVVLTMISNVPSCSDSQIATDIGKNLLLSMPSTIPHPPGATGQTTAVLPQGSADYTTIYNWIKAGCTP